MDLGTKIIVKQSQIDETLMRGYKLSQYFTLFSDIIEK